MTEEDKALYIEMRTGSKPQDALVGDCKYTHSEPKYTDTQLLKLANRRYKRWDKSEVDKVKAYWYNGGSSLNAKTFDLVTSVRIGRNPQAIKGLRSRLGFIKTDWPRGATTEEVMEYK